MKSRSFALEKSKLIIALLLINETAVGFSFCFVYEFLLTIRHISNLFSYKLDLKFEVS